METTNLMRLAERGYSDGYARKTSLPPSMKWAERLAYERGYDKGRAAALRAKEQPNGND